MPKPSVAEQSEMDRRTTDIGLFNFAENYLLCGKTLTGQKIEGLRFADPIFYNLYHSIELFLKSYLRNKGIGAYELSDKYGHNLEKLYNKANTFGLTLEQKDVDRIKHFKAHQLVIESRYISTGSKQIVPLEGVLGTAERVRNAVQAELIAASVALRPGPFFPGIKFDTSHRTFAHINEDNPPTTDDEDKLDT